MSPQTNGFLNGKHSSSTSSSITNNNKNINKTMNYAPLPQSKYSHESNVDPNRPQKSLIITFFLWLFGGFFGLHHFYLHRDLQAFVWWCTFGGYFGIGWLMDFFKLRQMVKDFNEDPEYIAQLCLKMSYNKKPQFSTLRFIGAVTVGYFWGELYQMAIPQHVYAGIDWNFLHWGIPLFIALGVWAVGNIGREQGTLKHCLIAAYVVYPSRYYLYDESYWFLLTVFASAYAFDSWSKEWRRGPIKKRGFFRRILYITLAATIYLSIWGAYFYFNGTITDSDGDEVPIHEAIKNFLASPWWKDLKQTLHDTWLFAQHNGWKETWKQIFDTMDVDGERNAYKVLNLSATASQTEITKQWRKLSKEYHPDKEKDASKRREAQERFMEIQQAYEVLSNIKSKRKTRNKKFNEDL